MDVCKYQRPGHQSVRLRLTHPSYFLPKWDKQVQENSGGAKPPGRSFIMEPRGMIKIHGSLIFEAASLSSLEGDETRKLQDKKNEANNSLIFSNNN